VLAPNAGIDLGDDDLLSFKGADVEPPAGYAAG
jgi:hypothetical protein